ncbi:hypothetical protein SK128_004848 [Halocaridina rubra]|uniref:Uncharacterized protein n=1 Tax=Halocaridina rubra TaxID=373956 RepID=A0AAN8WRG2_HALRR
MTTRMSNNRFPYLKETKLIKKPKEREKTAPTCTPPRKSYSAAALKANLGQYKSRKIKVIKGRVIKKNAQPHEYVCTEISHMEIDALHALDRPDKVRL